MKFLNENRSQVLLCTRQNSCCPVISVNNNEVTIQDDYNGIVKMTLDQANLIGEALKAIKTGSGLDT